MAKGNRPKRDIDNPDNSIYDRPRAWWHAKQAFGAGPGQFGIVHQLELMEQHNPRMERQSLAAAAWVWNYKFPREQRRKMLEEWQEWYRTFLKDDGDELTADDVERLFVDAMAKLFPPGDRNSPAA